MPIAVRKITSTGQILQIGGGATDAEAEAAVAIPQGATDQDVHVVAPSRWPPSGGIPEDVTSLKMASNGTLVEYTLPESTPLEKLRGAFYQLFLTGLVFEGHARALASGYPASAAASLHDYLFYARQFSYLLFHSRDYTLAQKLAWCIGMGQGSLGISTANGLETAAKLFFNSADLYTPPTTPSAWRDPADASARALNDLATMAGTIPGNTDFAGGAWIASADPGPISLKPIPDVVLEVDEDAWSLDLTAHFWDSSDLVAYTTSSSSVGLVVGTIVGSTLTLTPTAAGTKTMTIRAARGSIYTELSFLITVEGASSE